MAGSRKNKGKRVATKASTRHTTASGDAPASMPDGNSAAEGQRQAAATGAAPPTRGKTKKNNSRRKVSSKKSRSSKNTGTPRVIKTAKDTRSSKATHTSKVTKTAKDTPWYRDANQWKGIVDFKQTQLDLIWGEREGANAFNSARTQTFRSKKPIFKLVDDSFRSAFPGARLLVHFDPNRSRQGDTAGVYKSFCKILEATKSPADLDEFRQPATVTAATVTDPVEDLVADLSNMDLNASSTAWSKGAVYVYRAGPPLKLSAVANGMDGVVIDYLPGNLYAVRVGKTEGPWVGDRLGNERSAFPMQTIGGDWDIDIPTARDDFRQFDDYDGSLSPNENIRQRLRSDPSLWPNLVCVVEVLAESTNTVDSVERAVRGHLGSSLSETWISDVLGIGDFSKTEWICQREAALAAMRQSYITCNYVDASGDIPHFGLSAFCNEYSRYLRPVCSWPRAHISMWGISRTLMLRLLFVTTDEQEMESMYFVDAFVSNLFQAKEAAIEEGDDDTSGSADS